MPPKKRKSTDGQAPKAKAKAKTVGVKQEMEESTNEATVPETVKSLMTWFQAWLWLIFKLVDNRVAI